MRMEISGKPCYQVGSSGFSQLQSLLAILAQTISLTGLRDGDPLQGPVSLTSREKAFALKLPHRVRLAGVSIWAQEYECSPNLRD